MRMTVMTERTTVRKNKDMDETKFKIKYLNQFCQ